MTALPSHPPAFLAFVLPALLPYALRLLSAGDRASLLMSATVLVYIAATSAVALELNRALRHAARLHWSNTRLVTRLERSRRELERRVEQRTAELQAVNDALVGEVDPAPPVRGARPPPAGPRRAHQPAEPPPAHRPPAPGAGARPPLRRDQGVLLRPRPLQGGQRHARPPRRRRAAARARPRGCARALRGGDTVARLGGDEFARARARRRRRARGGRLGRASCSHALERPFALGGVQRSTVDASVGIALSPEHGARRRHAAAPRRRRDVRGQGAPARRRIYAPERDRTARRAARASSASCAAPSSDDELVLVLPAEARRSATAASWRRRGARALAAPGARPAAARRVHPARRAHRADRARSTDWVLDAARCEQVRALARRAGRDAARRGQPVGARACSTATCPTRSRALLDDARARPGAARARDHRERAHGRPGARARAMLRELQRARRAARDRRLRHRLLVARLPAPRCRSTSSRSTGLRAATWTDDRATRRSCARSSTLGHNLGLTVVAEGVETAQRWRPLRASAATCPGLPLGRPAPAEAVSGLLAA